MADVATWHQRAEAATARQCTCHSGDGSLRWPCPAHPAGPVPEAMRAVPVQFPAEAAFEIIQGGHLARIDDHDQALTQLGWLALFWREFMAALAAKDCKQ